jgi:predicted transcriptional regulator of viral defense system
MINSYLTEESVMKKYDQVYQDKLVVKESLQEYASPRSKLTRMLDSKQLLHIRRGLYLAGSETPFSLKTLANIIAGPSYVSFESALAFYGFIPERVLNITSAIYGKNKHKRFETPVGSFLYRHIPEAVYFMEYRRLEEDGHPFLIATAEKAICDTLYQHRQVTTLSGLSKLIYEDLRVEEADSLKNLDLEIIKALAPGYGKKVTTLFARWLEKEINNA